MPPRQRLLIFGFSCTSLRQGYATTLLPSLRSTSEHTEVVVSGLGGLGPPVVPFALDRLLAERGPFTHVLLEIGTSIYARTARESEAEATALIHECAHRITAARARPALLLLHRDGLDPQRIRWNDLLRSYCEAHQIPLIDLAEGLIADIGIEGVHSLLRDNVHTTPEGSRVLSDRMLPGILAWLASEDPVPQLDAPEFVRKAHELAPHAVATDRFEGNNFAMNCAVLEGGESLSVQFARPLRAFGITFVYGPRSGTFSITLNGDHEFEFAGYDEFSFYRRIGMRSFGPPQGRWVSSIAIKQRSELPDVQLKAGNPDLSPRRGLVGSLLYFDKAN